MKVSDRLKNLSYCFSVLNSMLVQQWAEAKDHSDSTVHSFSDSASILDEFSNHGNKFCSQTQQQSFLNSLQLWRASSPWQQQLRLVGIVVYRDRKQSVNNSAPQSFITWWDSLIFKVTVSPCSAHHWYERPSSHTEDLRSVRWKIRRT